MELAQCRHQGGGSGQKSMVGGDYRDRNFHSVSKRNNGAPKTVYGRGQKATELSN